MTRRERRRKNRVRWRRKTRKTRRTTSRRATSRRTATRRSAKASRRRFRRARARTYGPVRFSDQPNYVRKRGRKSLNKGKSAYRRRRSKARRSSRSRQTTRLGWSSDYALARAMGIRSPKGMRRKKARRWMGREAMRRSRKTAGTPRSMSQIMRILEGTKLKAWVCAGPRRTGCGGGRRRYGGSRQIGVLRP